MASFGWPGLLIKQVILPGLFSSLSTLSCPRISTNLTPGLLLPLLLPIPIYKIHLISIFFICLFRLNVEFAYIEWYTDIDIYNINLAIVTIPAGSRACTARQPLHAMPPFRRSSCSPGILLILTPFPSHRHK